MAAHFSVGIVVDKDAPGHIQHMATDINAAVADIHRSINNLTTTVSNLTTLVNSRFAPLALMNGTIVESHVGNAATFAIKTAAGADPSSRDPVYILFGDGSLRTLAAALSLTISSGSTLGTANATPFRAWLVIVDDAGTLRLGAQQCASVAGTSIIGFPGNGIISSTAEGGAGAADSAGVTYTNTAVSSKRFCVIGHAEYDSGLTTAGTWSASPTRINLYGPGMPLPGAVIQTKSFATVATTTTASTTFVDTALTVSITPTSPINGIEAIVAGNGLELTAGAGIYSTLARGTTAFGSIAFHQSNTDPVNAGGMPNYGWDFPATTSATNYLVRIRANTATNVTYNSNATSTISVKEVMA